ncbi:MAG: hypothetical protein AAGD38_06740 [Acidobacteriota bacterium]
MSALTRARVEQAFLRLFEADHPLFLASAITNGVRIRRDIIHPFRFVPMADTEPLSLFHADPWRGVAIELVEQRISGFASVILDGLFVDTRADEVRLGLEFPSLECTGRYIVRTGHGAKTALESAADVAGESPNVTLAKQQQTQLIQSDNGLLMVGAYWDNNRTFNEIVNLPNFKILFGNGTYKNMANDTAVAVGQKPTSQVINPGGSSGTYNSNAGTVRAFVAGQAQKGAQYYCGKGDTATAQRYWNSFIAATSFKNQVQAVADKENTADDVNNAVKNTPTPNLPKPGNACDQLNLARAELRPEVQEALEEAERHDREATFEFVDDPVGEARKEAARAGGVPIDGSFRADLANARLTAVGRLTYRLGRRSPGIEFTHIEAEVPEVQLQLATFPEPLFSAVNDSLAESQFLRDVLGQRLATSLDDEQLRAFLGSTASLALAAEGE